MRTQNPDLNRLREIISKPASLAALRSGISFERSYDLSKGDARRFREALTHAKDDIQQAKATVTTGYKREKDLLTVMEEILLYSNAVHEEMKNTNSAKK